MKPETFQEIKEGEMKRGLGEERAEKAAGAAYWRAAKAKYKKGKKSDTMMPECLKEAYHG
jgi:hypothetical protein